ncbi:MAG: M28 family peptidase [Planctomycetota bacterium]|nr:M28 family peptidase [Planctomycetota bacterium]
MKCLTNDGWTRLAGWFACVVLLANPSLVRAQPSSKADAAADADASKSAPIIEPGSIAAAEASIKQPDIRKHIRVLASDTFEGREAGTRGGIAAGVYIVKQLEAIGVESGVPDGTFYQGFGRNYRNILGVIRGSDATLKNEYILVGAHFDHVGYGRRGNSNGPFGFIHNGADDNASGTTALIEIAEAILSLTNRPKRSVLFTFWDAEEMGLLGSEHWSGRPSVPLKQVKLAVNIDMIGRLRKDTLQMYGSRTAPGLRRFVSEHNVKPNLSIDFDWDLLRDSDHYPLAQRQIPFVMPYTMKHYDYHRPSDDIEKLDYEGLERIGRFVFHMVLDAANRDSLSAFRAEAFRENNQLRDTKSPVKQRPPRLGISFKDHVGDADEAPSVEVTAVATDLPGDRAGLRIGDRIVRIGGRPTGETPDFRSLVLAANSPAEIEVRREGEAAPIKLQVEMDGSKLRIGVSYGFDPAEPGVARLSDVVVGSPAHFAKLAQGDRVHRVNGKTFTNGEEFVRLLNEQARSATVTRERLGQIQTVELHLPSP